MRHAIDLRCTCVSVTVSFAGIAYAHGLAMTLPSRMANGEQIVGQVGHDAIVTSWQKRPGKGKFKFALRRDSWQTNGCGTLFRRCKAPLGGREPMSSFTSRSRGNGRDRRSSETRHWRRHRAETAPLSKNLSDGPGRTGIVLLTPSLYFREQ